MTKVLLNLGLESFVIKGCYNFLTLFFSGLCAQVENSTKKKSKMCGDVVQSGTCTAENPEQKPVL